MAGFSGRPLIAGRPEAGCSNKLSGTLKVAVSWARHGQNSQFLRMQLTRSSWSRVLSFCQWQPPDLSPERRPCTAPSPRGIKDHQTLSESVSRSLWSKWMEGAKVKQPGITMDCETSCKLSWYGYGSTLLDPNNGPANVTYGSIIAIILYLFVTQIVDPHHKSPHMSSHQSWGSQFPCRLEDRELAAASD